MTNILSLNSANSGKTFRKISIVLGNCLCDVFCITEITLVQDQQNGDMLLLTSESFLVTCIVNQI